jgi:dihydroxy-acid dehydratase
MGHEGMRFSLVSREIIADSVETVMHAERLDGSVCSPGATSRCPACSWPPPASTCPRCSSTPGRSCRATTTAEALDIDHRRVRGRRRARRALMSREELDEIERAICPGEGACGGMFTANTMASSPRRSACRCPARRPRRPPTAAVTGSPASPARPSSSCCAAASPPRDIMTKEAFENAIAVVMALGGSTNAVLHLLAIAHEADVDLSLSDFNRIGAKVPHLADVKPRAASST